MARFWFPLSFLLWGSWTYAFQLPSTGYHACLATWMDSRVVLHARYNDDDFAASRVAQRLAAEARRKAEMERRAREAAERLAEEARRAEEALKRAARQAASKMKDGKMVEIAEVSAKEASQWAQERVEERMWKEAIKKAAEKRRQIVEQARLNAEAEAQAKVAKSERAQWAMAMVDSRLKAQASRMLNAREQIMMLSLKALEAEKNRRLAEQAAAEKARAEERRAWAEARVAKRIRIQAEKQAEIDQINFERGLLIAMRMRNTEASRRKALKEAEARAAAADRARWAAAKVEARLRKARS